jgi:hypothetical protein
LGFSVFFALVNVLIAVVYGLLVDEDAFHRPFLNGDFYLFSTTIVFGALGTYLYEYTRMVDVVWGAGDRPPRRLSIPILWLGIVAGLTAITLYLIRALAFGNPDGLPEYEPTLSIFVAGWAALLGLACQLRARTLAGLVAARPRTDA